MLVTPVGCGGDAVDADVRVALAGPVDDPPVAVGGGVMGLVDDHEIERRHGLEVGRAGKRRDHGEGRAPAPRLGAGIDDRGRERRVDLGEFEGVLGGQLVAVGEHAGLGVAAGQHLADDAGEHQGLPTACRSDAEGIAVLVERAHAALDEGLLAGTKQQGPGPPIAPRPAGSDWPAAPPAPGRAAAGRPVRRPAPVPGPAALARPRAHGAGPLPRRRREGHPGATVRPPLEGLPVLVVRRDGEADFVTRLAVPVLADIDLRQELDAVEHGETVDAPDRLRLRRGVLLRQAAGRVEDAAHERPAHVGPLGALGAREADQAPHPAPCVGALEEHELGVEIDRAGGLVAGGVAPGPALARIVVAARLDGHAHGRDGALGDDVVGGLLLGIVEVVPGSGHGWGAPSSCVSLCGVDGVPAGAGAGRPNSSLSLAGLTGPPILVISRPRWGSSI